MDWKRFFTRYSTVVAGVTAVLASACSSSADGVLIKLAPEVISSEDGTLHVEALVIDERTPLEGWDVRVSVLYVDRNGEERPIDDQTGTTDQRGAFETVITGLSWEGSGLVSVEVLDETGAPVLGEDGESVKASASFSVLDRTAPTVTILAPTEDLRVGAGFPLEVTVQVEDEIGVSQVFLEATGELDRLRSTVVASGATSATVTFDMDIPNNARPGPTITLYALAEDLSGNQAAAEPVTLTVDPAIAVAGTDGLMGSQLAEGDGQLLNNPRAIAISPMDGLLYIADSAGGACGGTCIRVMNPADGSIVDAALVIGNGDIEGVAFDASGDNLYFTDRQDRLMRMTWNATNMQYEGTVSCNDPNNQDPAEPYHLVHDGTLGAVVADRDSQRLKTLATCTGNDPNDFTTDAFDRPWGVAQGAGGEFYVSDENDDRIYRVETNGNVSLFENRRLDQPRGIEWIGGGMSAFADSLFVANFDARTILSTVGMETARTAVYLRNRPVDLAFDGTALYIVTQPSAGNPGRVFTVTGF